ncbi:hypothetical protein D9757_011870 [Collybiopsis confluens]|uniref:Uncharacterized protein n=1 Tax=Collybiopsis confluens TaxID=2823264 RepID=A0A8H5D3L9_9AGAR|nr:hypothetical protein D9757_011870 [Collybiopsis confluens]
MLLIMFGASLLISAVSIIHAVFLLGPSGLLEAITAQAESGTALIVANLGILSPYAYRYFRNGQDFDTRPYTYYHSFGTDGEVRMRRLPRTDSNHARISTVRFQADSSTIQTDFTQAESIVSDTDPGNLKGIDIDISQTTMGGAFEQKFDRSAQSGVGPVTPVEEEVERGKRSLSSASPTLRHDYANV